VFSPQNPVRGDPAVWSPGVDADGRDVTIRASGVSGVVVAGLAGYGKTSLLNARFCQLATSSAVQFVLIDGKGGPDYDDLFARAWLSAKDDPQQVRDHLSRVHELMTARQGAIRSVLGTKNMWHSGRQPPGRWSCGDRRGATRSSTRPRAATPKSKRRDALARETVRLVEELVRKGRNVGIQVVLATRRPPGTRSPPGSGTTGAGVLVGCS